MKLFQTSRHAAGANHAALTANASEYLYPSRLSPRLNPFDGLFLRAAHLDAISEFALTRQQAVARAGGTGVVRGLQVCLTKDNCLAVASGEAIDENGRTVSLSEDVVVSVPWERAPHSGVLVVVIEGADQPEGRESVYSALCDDPCASGTSVSTLTYPYRADRCRISFVSVELAPKNGNAKCGDPTVFDHSRIVSAWFEKERRRWRRLVPASPLDGPPGYAEIADSRAWLVGPSPQEPWPLRPESVALGLVWSSACGYVVDQWAARRELIEPSARSVAEQRFGMRPLSVFLAQIHQFQSQLHGGATEVVQSMFELPPAGYLPCKDPTELFEKACRNVVNRFECRLDEISRFVLEAQHLDRIDLHGHESPSIDVFIPDDATFTAFRRSCICRRPCRTIILQSDAPVNSEAGESKGGATDPAKAVIADTTGANVRRKQKDAADLNSPSDGS